MPQILTVKQEKFCVNYFKSGNATEAAIKAGYSKKSANAIAGQNLAKLSIKARMAELRKRAEDASVASVIERKQILTEILRAKLPDFMELGKDGSWVNIGPETPGGRAIQEIHSRTEYDENGEHPTIYTSVKLHDPIKAIQELNKMEHIYDDSTKVDVNIDQREVVYNLINPDTKILLERLESGDRETNLESNVGISQEPGSLPQPENKTIS